MFTPAKTLVIPLFGVLVLAASAMAQSAEQAAPGDASVSPTPLIENTVPAQNDGAAAGEQPAPPPNLGQGTKAEAQHSAEATAHKSLNDPNNQLGTSTSGRTRPIVQADGTPQPLPSAQPAAQ